MIDLNVDSRDNVTKATVNLGLDSDSKAEFYEFLWKLKAFCDTKKVLLEVNTFEYKKHKLYEKINEKQE